MLANNNSRIPNQDLNELMDVISAQFFLICRKWKEHFVLILYPFTVNHKSTAHIWAADLLLAGWMEQNLDGTINLRINLDGTICFTLYNVSFAKKRKLRSFGQRYDFKSKRI